MLTTRMIAGCVLVALLVVQVVMTFPASDLDFFPEQDQDITTQKRSYLSCRRCLHRSSDWTSCLACYGSPGGSRPYYGAAKRAYDPSELREALNAIKRAYNPYDNEDLDKKAFNPYDFGEGIHKRAYNPYEFNEGFVNKRAYNPYESDEGYYNKRAYNPYETEERGKRGFRDCQCCMRTGMDSCCDKCYFKSYNYKRAYSPVVFQDEQDQACGCCNTDTFDFACCLNCSYTAKKK